MSITIYHNPRCSKSRRALTILREKGVDARVVEYLNRPPAAATILGIARMLELPVADLVRTGEDEFRDADDLPALDDDSALAAWLERHPRALQRPIVVDEDAARAVVGRPPENVESLLDG